MLAGPVCLDLCVELVYVVGHRDDHTLHRNIPYPCAEVSSEPHAIFRLTERSFCLYAPVHPELYPLIACDPFKALRPLLNKCPRYLDPLVPFFKGRFAVVSFDTFFFIGATIAVFADIKGRFSLIAGSRSPYASAIGCKPVVIPTDVTVVDGVIGHVFKPADILLVTAGL